MSAHVTASEIELEYEISASAYWICRDWPETGPSVLYGQPTLLLY